MVEIFKAKIFLTLNVLNEIIWSTEGQGDKQFFSPNTHHHYIGGWLKVTNEALDDINWNHLSNYFLTSWPNYIFNKKVRPTLKSLGDGLKSVQNSKKVLEMGL